MSRRRARKRWKWLFQGVAFIVLVLAIAAGWLWWTTRHWLPDSTTYPDQGALIGAHNSTVNFPALKAFGASFVYLEASAGTGQRNPNFSEQYTAAQRAGLQIGAVHRFNPCARADGQSANFATIVPRSKALLPAAIALDKTAQDCSHHVSDAAVQSELMTLINQVELHTGAPVILKVSPDFEYRYGISGRIERNLWLSRTRLEPDYTGRPWLLWTANAMLQNAASATPVSWIVVQP